MAEQQQNPGAVINSFTKGMVKDMNETFVGEGFWTHARNLVNNNHDGQSGVVGNEPATLSCVTLPYDLIGAIHLTDDQWAIFTTDDINSEIGVFDESKCLYEKKVNDPCLGFKRTHLITGASRKRFDCERPVYFADGLNPDRFIDLDNIPWKYTETEQDGCIIKTITEPRKLDCEKIRMAPLLKHPCINLKKGQVSGTLPNGSYQAVIAYSEKGVRFSSYLGLSEVQSLFTHENVSSSLELIISDIDTTYDEFELVIIARVNGTTVAKKIGNYSTSQGAIYIDRWDQEFETVPLSQVVFRGDASEKSDAIYEVNNYLMKVGDYTKFKFNYQKQANQIKANWVAVEYPADYYIKGGNNTGYLRDEQYAFFIRFIYNTGERSESYHIPGRPATIDDRQNIIGGDAFETTGASAVTRERWQVENTASVQSIASYTLPDGGRVIASGEMGFWESTEEYPADRIDVWGELCGKKIRHHKMPDVTINGGSVVNHFSNGGNNIVILGVEFSNITAPLDNNGNPITSIVGYEILRGSREGNQSIIGKGLINNMREYTIPTNNSVRGLFQNYPYNDLNPDKFLTESPRKDNEGVIKGQANVSTPEMTGVSKRLFSFHSPEVTFSNPFLNPAEVKIYQEMTGSSRGQFETPYRHPKFKVLNNTATVIGSIVGVISALNIFSTGITVGATEDHPIGLQIGPLPPFPQRPRPQVGVGSTTIPDPDLISEVTYYAQLALWGANLVSLLSAMDKFADLQKEKFLSLMRMLVPKKQYAAQYVSHGFYDNTLPSAAGNRRRRILEASYISSGVQSFNIQYQVNNTNRSKMVVFQTDTDIANPTVIDNSRVTLGDLNTGLYQSVTRTISSHYGALKLSIPSQYGQLESIKQMPISGGCVLPITPDKNKSFNTPVLFGGDIYINRFTEKNTMPFFTDWLMGEPDETEFDYTLYINLPYPRYWINNTEYNGSILQQASDLRALDWRKSTAGSLYVQRGYFYLFNSGVRDFFVESEINLAFRDWEDEPAKRHYDPYRFTDLSLMFRSDLIKSGDFYKYDYNLSISKLFNSHITWGNMLGRDYDSKVAEQCYTYRPSRVRYSLPQQEESRKDNWRVFLTNNYRDFQSPVTSIKPVNRTGALFMMARQSPLQFMGVEELKMDGTGAKITIGDGGLFSQPLQSIVNTEASFEYGSCQNKYAVMNTPHGVFWVSQNQGKVFQYSGQINEISRNGLKWWFAKYLPSELLKVYQEYPLGDNPVAGIGVQMIYDNTNEVLYISKKDYKPKRKDLLYDEKGFYYKRDTTETIQICPYDYVLQDGVCVPKTPKCPNGYYYSNGQCVKIEEAEVIESGTVVPVTRTPYEEYGSGGTKVYEAGLLTSDYTLLTSDFWIRQELPPAEWSAMTADEKQAYSLNNGPVNRLAIWGNADGLNLNNYNHEGANLNPVNEWIGFDVCINTPVSRTYFVAIAADNRYRILLDGDLLLEDQNIATSPMYTDSFRYLHIFPITIHNPGSHILRVEGYNDGIKAGFGCEIYDLDNRPSGMTPAEFLAAQTNYDNLNVIFTTRNVTQFSSNLFSCPEGYGITNISCNKPVCRKTLTADPIVETVKPTIVPVEEKIYTPFTDTQVWEDASWTISYDCKNQMWLSFHDWKPSFLLPSKNHFMSVAKQTIWKHNQRCDLFCNFYDVDYPFDVEFVSSTGQVVNSVRSVEYLMEAYRYYNNCQDKFHVLDENFDHAMIYNSEQVSGLLEMVVKQKSNPFTMLNYPQINTSSITIQFSKEENKYRFNQFWDITKDRGEFSGVSVPMFVTKPNGYEFEINPQYVNYQKSPLERKKFRHQVNRVFLRKLKSGSLKLMFKISNQKLLQSPR